MPFREEEVFVALNELNGDKAPSPDCFSVAFFQASWHFVKEEILGLFREFFETETLVKSLNTMFF